MTSSSAAPDPRIGKVIADCLVKKRVGEGGFGVVYRAEDRKGGGTVALKLMSRDQASREDVVKKFLRGAIAAARLQHPNLVRILRVGKDEAAGVHYVVMEFLEGKTLARVLEDRGPLAPAEAVPLMLQAAGALGAAHERHVIHRDVKPENLMLIGPRLATVKITDIGLAKTMHGTAKTTKVMGTPHYMPPEQFQGKGMDGRTDIYALGVTLYHALSRSFPYDGANSMQIVYQILTSEPQPLPAVAPKVPARLWEIIRKMISREREDRHACFADVITDLKAWQGTSGGK